MKRILAAAGLCFLATTFNAQAGEAECINDNNINCRTVDRDTLVLRGDEPREYPRQGLVSFTLDARRVSGFDYLGNNYFAISSPGKPSMQRGTLCPYFDLAKQAYRIDKTDTERVFRITARASQDQIDAVKKYRCVITDKPPWSRIGPLL